MEDNFKMANPSRGDDGHQPLNYMEVDSHQVVSFGTDNGFSLYMFGGFINTN